MRSDTDRLTHLTFAATLAASLLLQSGNRVASAQAPAESSEAASQQVSPTHPLADNAPENAPGNTPQQDPFGSFDNLFPDDQQEQPDETPEQELSADTSETATELVETAPQARTAAPTESVTTQAVSVQKDTERVAAPAQDPLDPDVELTGWSEYSSATATGHQVHQSCSCGHVTGSCTCGMCQTGLYPAPCIDCPRATTLNPYFNVRIFGAAKVDMLFSEARPVAPGTPYFLFPGSTAGLSQNTFDLHARQSTLGAIITGPQLGDFQVGGTFLAFFYNDNALADAYGILPGQAFGELKNQDWRFAAGLQFDVFNPAAPTVLPFSVLSGSGNTGNVFRGQLRVERFLRPSEDRQWTIQLALSEPVTTVIDPAFGLVEDNGWPNLEGRVALGLGCLEGQGPTAQRPIEVGVSGVVGQLRKTELNANSVTFERLEGDVWGLGLDLRWKINDMFGVMAEFYTGQGLGTYNGAVLQIANPDNNYSTIRSTGGWGEFFVYWSPALHSHFGYGIDNPHDGEVAARQRSENSTAYANVIWDINAAYRIAFEVSRRDTEYQSRFIPDNDGMFFHTQFTWNF